MKIDYVVTAFLKNGDNYLLMKRADDRRYYPGVWSGIGGGVKAGEEWRPERACLREITEETGIAADNITNLKMRYIHISPGKFNPGAPYVVIHFVFFGDTNETAFVDTDEGKLYWVPGNEVCGKDYTAAMKRLAEHYFGQGKDDEVLYLYNEGDGDIKPLKGKD